MKGPWVQRISSFVGSIALLTPCTTRIAAAADAGIAALYPGDHNIASDPAVIFADDFESYTSPAQITSKWDDAYQLPNIRIATEPGNFFAGTKALEFQLPISATEVANSLKKQISPEQDTVFFRAYTKFDSGYSVNGSNHNGLRLSAKYPGPGIIPPADGTGFFLFLLQNNIMGTSLPGETAPGYSHIYAYWPKQRSAFGDHWYPDGMVKPYSTDIGNEGDWVAFPSEYPDFKPMPNFLPQRNRWYCYELMVRANTPGRSDGEVKYWIDGDLVSDFPNLNIRSLSTLKIDEAHIGLHALHSERVNKKWYDNVVIATQYIGPMTGASPAPSTTPTPTPPPTVQSLTNISTRGAVQTGDGVLIGGFVLKGNGPTEVLIRGLGPSLTASSVAHALGDPLLELHDATGSLIGWNDNWKTDFNHNSVPVALQPSNDLESALDRSLSPGSYTVILKDAHGGSGVGLFELYQLGAGGVLENISTRGMVQTRDDVMIGGFVLNGNSGSSRRVLLRALGPSLGQFGIGDVLANPSIRIYDSNGTVLGQNDNWKDTQATEISQTPLAPANDLESALILTLPGGSYTAVVSGVDGGTGNALVEAYLLSN